MIESCTDIYPKEYSREWVKKCAYRIYQLRQSPENGLEQGDADTDWFWAEMLRALHPNWEFKDIDEAVFINFCRIRSCYDWEHGKIIKYLPAFLIDNSGI